MFQVELFVKEIPVSYDFVQSKYNKLNEDGNYTIQSVSRI